MSIPRKHEGEKGTAAGHLSFAFPKVICGVGACMEPVCLGDALEYCIIHHVSGGGCKIIYALTLGAFTAVLMMSWMIIEWIEKRHGNAIGNTDCRCITVLTGILEAG